MKSQAISPILAQRFDIPSSNWSYMAAVKFPQRTLKIPRRGQTESANKAYHRLIT